MLDFSDIDFQRRELGTFLKRKRASISPETLLLGSNGGRRRTVGLRREDVAFQAGVGLTWYTWLEQGRDINVSTAFVEQLSKALRLNHAERAYVFAMAHRRPPPISNEHQKIPAASALQSILDCIEKPAYARNHCFDVLAWNEANTRYFGDFSKISPLERNIIWLMFTKTKYRNVMPEWEADSRRLVANLRLRLAEATDRTQFQILINRLYETSADFQRIWNQHEVDSIGEGVSKLVSPRLGTACFGHFTLVPEGFNDTHIVVFAEK